MEKVFLMWSKNRWEDHSNAELFFKTLKVTVWSQEVYMKANCNLEIWTRVIMGRKNQTIATFIVFEILLITLVRITTMMRA